MTTLEKERSRNPIMRIDLFIVVLYLLLITAGWISICGASHEIGETNFFDMSTRSGKQLMWIGLSLSLATFIMMIDEHFFDSSSVLIYMLMLLLLLVTPFIAKDIKGSRSWISLGAVSLQPAEFAKCATALALAKLIGQYGFTLNEMRNLGKAAALVLVPLFLIIMQKETGSALVFFAFFLMFYREGMPGAILFTAVAAVVYFVVGVRFSEDILPHSLATIGQVSVLTLIWLFIVGMCRIYLPRTPHAARLLTYGVLVHLMAWLVTRFLIPFDVAWVQIVWLIFIAGYLAWHGLGERLRHYFLISAFALGSTAFLYSADYALNNILQPHQQTRIKVLLGLEDDPTGAGYNVNQSKISIGSGGLLGKGFMNGTQTKLKYVPEQDTDFIFCTVGEEQGFLGTTLVLCFFLTLILRIYHVAERQSSTFSRVYGYCVASILLFHIFINVGMVIGITPVIGIPLPFFSYGGSSLWGFTLLLFIFLRLDSGDKLRRR